MGKWRVSWTWVDQRLPRDAEWQRKSSIIEAETTRGIEQTPRGSGNKSSHWRRAAGEDVWWGAGYVPRLSDSRAKSRTMRKSYSRYCSPETLPSCPGKPGARASRSRGARGNRKAIARNNAFHVVNTDSPIQSCIHNLRNVETRRWLARR